MRITKMTSLIIIFILQYVSIKTCRANNALYVTLSNQITSSRQLEVISNNLANIDTIGFEEDSLLMQHVDIGDLKNASTSFVDGVATYKSNNLGPLKQTGRALDVAIAGDGYFAVKTPNGFRFTLDGSFIINGDNVITNSFGHPMLSVNYDIFEIPGVFNSIDINKNGTIFVDEQEIGTIGVFTFANKNALLMEGENLSIAIEEPIVSNDHTILNGMLRSSNVNSANALSKMVELQRSHGQASDLMKKIHESEKLSMQLIR